MDYRSNCVKNLSVLSALLKFSPFFKKKNLCASVDSIGDSKKLQQNQDP